MIHAVLIFNNEGKARLSKFYSNQTTTTNRYKTLKSIYESISKRPIQLCNFILDPNDPSQTIVYRNYATLYFVMIIDQNESELSILDLIQVFVESLDQCFPSVCELDLIFHYDQLQLLLSQLIVGGIVLNTSLDSIVNQFKQISSNSSKHSGNHTGFGDASLEGGGGIGFGGIGMGSTNWKPFG